MKPITFCILDGWGISEKSLKNAVRHAKTPNFSHLVKNFPSTQILASGNEVGLPKGQVGNSEVGHMNICLLYTSPSPRDLSTSRMPSSA